MLIYHFSIITLFLASICMCECDLRASCIMDFTQHSRLMVQHGCVSTFIHTTLTPSKISHISTEWLQHTVFDWTFILFWSTMPALLDLCDSSWCSTVSAFCSCDSLSHHKHLHFPKTVYAQDSFLLFCII